MTHTLKIPDWKPPLVNELLKMHWAARGRLNKTTAELVGVLAHQQQIPKATGKRRVSVHVVLSGRQKKCDGDAPYKVLLDALVACERLIDDSTEWVELALPTFGRGDRTETTITLEDMEP